MIELGTGRPKNGYRLDGDPVPGVTTVLGRFKDSGGLIRWAYKQGKKGVELYESRDKAADIGSVVHDACEAHVHGKDPYDLVNRSALEGLDMAAAHVALTSYMSWAKMSKVEYVATEVALVSPTMRVGGTLDCIARINDQLVVLDWKTSKGVYPDYYIQCCAYALLWEEMRGDRIEAAHLCRFSKSGSFAHYMWPDLEPGRDQFKAFVKCYRRDKTISAMI